MKVLGAKVSDKFYEKFKTKINGSISSNVYTACKMYLELKVNHKLTTCKRKNSSCEYQGIQTAKLREIHLFIDNLKPGDK